MQVWTFYFASKTCWAQENKLGSGQRDQLKCKGSREMEKRVQLQQWYNYLSKNNLIFFPRVQKCWLFSTE